MASPTELDIFTRSVSGDHRARTELFKKFLRDNSRVRRLGTGYTDSNDFLQDCLGSLLRAARSWDKEEGLSHWVESVAVCTALQNARQHDISTRAQQGAIRMCAEIEGEDGTQGELLNAYAPPLTGSDDSPQARILALLAEPERSVFRTRAIEESTWEETAAAAGKPLNTVGPIFARVTARLARLFGAPPPMDDDLVTVFSRAAADPLRPEGRAISLQLDATFYSVTPEMRRTGLATSYDARVVLLWETAAAETPPGDALRRHLDQCHYCAALSRALTVMHQALQSDPGVGFHFCPGSLTLANPPEMAREAFDLHLADCTICREEQAQALGGQLPQAQDFGAAQSTAGAGKKIAWVSAALLVLGIASFAGYRYLGAQKTEVPVETMPVTTDTPTVAPDRRYQDLVQSVPMDDTRILATVRPENRSALRFAIDQFGLGQTSQALAASRDVALKGNDPGAQMLYAMSLYHRGLMTDGYREMLKAEAMPPRDSFRCWIMFQFALMVADRRVMDREADHLSSDPTYREQVRKVMTLVRERG